MFRYNLINIPFSKVNSKIIDKIFKKISNLIVRQQNGILNIVFVDENSIKNLNKNYRKIDKITDVLSFHYFDNFDDLKDEDIAGEIILCEEKIIKQAETFGLGFEKEFYKLVIHSILHILGYDHENELDYKIMNKLEKIIWKEVFENN